MHESFCLCNPVVKEALQRYGCNCKTSIRLVVFYIGFERMHFEDESKPGCSLDLHIQECIPIANSLVLTLCSHRDDRRCSNWRVEKGSKRDVRRVYKAAGGGGFDGLASNWCWVGRFLSRLSRGNKWVYQSRCLCRPFVDTAMCCTNDKKQSCFLLEKVFFEKSSLFPEKIGNTLIGQYFQSSEIQRISKYVDEKKDYTIRFEIHILLTTDDVRMFIGLYLPLLIVI